MNHICDIYMASGQSIGPHFITSPDQIFSTMLETSTNVRLTDTGPKSPKEVVSLVKTTSQHKNPSQKSEFSREMHQTPPILTDGTNSKASPVTSVSPTVSGSTYPYHQQSRRVSTTSKLSGLDVQRPGRGTEKESGAVRRSSIKSSNSRSTQPLPRRITRSMLKDDGK